MQNTGENRAARDIVASMGEKVIVCVSSGDGD